MKLFISIMLLGTFAIADMPFVHKELADVFKYNTTGNKVKQVAKAEWSYAKDGGAVGAYGLGVYLPAASLVNFAYMYFVEQVVDGGAGTGALSCEDANNLYSAADVTGNAAGSVVLGVPQNGAANMVKSIAAQCELTWTIAGSNATAGDIIFFVEYFKVK